MPVSKLSQDRMEQINSQMLRAGGIGFLKGSLAALVTGSYINYRYNYGHNARFFLTPYKIWYFVVWGIVGITFAAETAKLNITKELAEEEDLRRAQYFSAELGEKR